MAETKFMCKCGRNTGLIIERNNKFVKIKCSYSKCGFVWVVERIPQPQIKEAQKTPTNTRIIQLLSDLREEIVLGSIAPEKADYFLDEIKVGLAQLNNA